MIPIARLRFTFPNNQDLETVEGYENTAPHVIQQFIWMTETLWIAKSSPRPDSEALFINWEDAFGNITANNWSLRQQGEKLGSSLETPFETWTILWREVSEC